jgi:hypothetical protein
VYIVELYSFFMDNLKYPIGTFAPKITYTAEEIAEYITTIEQLPAKLASIVNHFTEQQLTTPYRPQGWTARQVIHHLADSHANSYIRFKLALTEHHPTIKPYEEQLWAELPDSKHFPIEASMAIIGGIHARWVACLRAMQPADWEKGFHHPEKNRVIGLAEAVALYAWHCEHHLGHIRIVAAK